MSLSLTGLGWQPALEHEFEHYASRGCVPARVSVQHRGAYIVYTEAGERWAEPAGRLRHLAAGAAERLAGYRKLLRELDHLESQRDGRRQAEQRRERRRAARSRRRASW